MTVKCLTEHNISGSYWKEKQCKHTVKYANLIAITKTDPRSEQKGHSCSCRYICGLNHLKCADIVSVIYELDDREKAAYTE